MKFSFLSLGVLTALAFVASNAHAQNRNLSTDLTNIAAAQNGGRILSVSSTFDNNKAYSANNLIDGQAFNFQSGSGSKGWASNQFDPINMDMVTIGFAGNGLRTLGKIVLNPSVDLTPERWAKDIEVQVSTETAEGPYTAVAQLTLKRDPAPQEFQMLPVPARFVRLMFRSNWGSDRAVGLGEVEIYEAIDGSDPMGGVINRFESAVNDLRRYRQVQSEGGNTTTAAAPPVATQQPASARGRQQGARVQKTQLVEGGAAGFPSTNVNIAATKNGGKIMAYSSTFNDDPAFGPDKLIDSNNYRPADDKGSNGWASQGFEPGKEYVTIGFADDRVKLIGKVTLNPVSNQSDLRWARRIDMQVTSGSFKDGPWKTAATLNLRPEAVNQDFVIRPVEAKYVRFIFQANGPGVVLPNADPNVNSDRAVSLGEIEIYEAVAGDDQLATLVSRFDQVLADLKTLRRRQMNDNTPTDDLVAPASLRRPAAGRAGATTVKTSNTPAKKNVEEALLKMKAAGNDG